MAKAKPRETNEHTAASLYNVHGITEPVHMQYKSQN